jgi:hypothetical protein
MITRIWRIMRWYCLGVIIVLLERLSVKRVNSKISVYIIKKIMIKLTEPQWGITLLKTLYVWMNASPFWSHWIPILADVFVFTYPVYLLLLYGY